MRGRINLRAVVAISIVYLISVTLSWHWLMPILMPEFFDNAANSFKYSDTLTYHNQAIELYNNLQKNGISEWQPAYNGNAPSSILGLIYYVTQWTNPRLYIPLAMVVHLSSVILVYLILDQIVDEFSAASGSILFAVSPVASIVYTEVGKDIWSIFAFLLLLYCVVSKRKIFELIFLASMSCLILLWMRPYLLYVANAAFIIALLSLLVQVNLPNRKVRVDEILRSAVQLTVLWSVVLGVMVANLSASILQKRADANSTILITSYQQYFNPSLDSNPDMDFIASIIDRARSRFNAFDGNTKIDGDIKFEKTSDVLVYAPKAVAIALAAPLFIDREAMGGKFQKLMHIVWLAYNTMGLILLFGILLIFREPRVPAVILISFVFMISLAFVVSNLGTFLRMRVGYFEFCMSIGLSGWLNYFCRHNRALG